MTYPMYGPGSSPVAGGLPAPVRVRAARSWLIGGLLTLLVATGIGAILLFQNGAPNVMGYSPAHGDPGNPGDLNAPAPDPREVPSPPRDCLVECTDTDEPGDSGTPNGAAANYSGSEDAAIGFVQAIANGDSGSAHSALCGSDKTRFPTPEELVADFYATLGFSTITGARLSDVYAADSAADAVVFELQTDAGNVLVEVYVIKEGSALTVCGYAFS